MAKTSIARGGDEILRPQSFYGSTPARPAALRTVDAAGKSNVGPNKALNILNTPSMFLDQQCEDNIVLVACRFLEISCVNQGKPAQTRPARANCSSSERQHSQPAKDLLRRTMCIDLNFLGIVSQ